MRYSIVIEFCFLFIFRFFLQTQRTKNYVLEQAKWLITRDKRRKLFSPLLVRLLAPCWTREIVNFIYFSRNFFSCSHNSLCFFFALVGFLHFPPKLHLNKQKRKKNTEKFLLWTSSRKPAGAHIWDDVALQFHNFFHVCTKNKFTSSSPERVLARSEKKWTWRMCCCCSMVKRARDPLEGIAVSNFFHSLYINLRNFSLCAHFVFPLDNRREQLWAGKRRKLMKFQHFLWIIEFEYVVLCCLISSQILLRTRMCTCTLAESWFIGRKKEKYDVNWKMKILKENFALPANRVLISSHVKLFFFPKKSSHKLHSCINARRSTLSSHET